MNIAHLLLHQAQKQPDALAIRYAGDDFTYEQFTQRVLQASAGLEAAGIAAGDVMAIALADPLDHWCATLALAHRGATVLSIPRSMADAQMIRLLNLTQCTRVLMDGGHRMSKTGPHLSTVSWTEVKAHALPNALATPVLDADRPWILVSGSGSTGQPKIMPVTHRAQWHRATLGRQWLPYGDEDILLSLVSMHFYAAKQRCLEALAMGAAIFLDVPGCVDHRKEVAAGEVTAIYGTVSHVELLLRSLPADHDLHYGRLRALMVGGSVVPMRLREQICQRLTPKLHVLWGSNESHTATITCLNEVFVTEGGVGRPFPGVGLEVVDDEGVPVAPGVDGHIRVSSASSITGYLGDPEATRKAFRNDWFYPGDIGHFTLDGQLVHRGRADDMMIVSGVNVYPAEIEECLRSFPGVADAFATPLRHQQLQDLPVALVVAAPGVSLDARALVQHVRNQIGRHTLHDLVFVERIPRNEQGKIQRKVVSGIMRAKWGTSGKPAATSATGTGSNASLSMGTLTLGFRLPPGGKPGALNTWLTVLEVPDDQLLPAGLSDTDQSATDDGQIWLHQVLTLARGLLHVLRVPLFDPIDVVQCRRAAPASKHWEAVCRVPDPSLVAQPLFESVLKVAFRLAAWISKADVASTADRERFFQTIERDVVRAFAKAQPNGKSTFEVLRVAHSLGVPYLPLPNGAFQLGWGRHARRIDRSTTDRDSAMGMHWTQNKLLTAQLLHQAGLPGPAHAVAKSFEQAREAAERFGYPVVVKPADLERGEGVSVDVRAENLEAAFNDAHKRSPGKLVLVEQQVPGVCHRLFITAGKLLYAVKRLPIGVYADGRSTIRALVAAECEVQQRIPPWKRSGIRPLDELALHMLRRQGWQPEAVPQAGQFVALRRIETTAWGGVDEEVTHTIHPDNVSAAIVATQIMGLEVAGVDMISRNIQQPWHANGAVINEVNYAPLLGGGEISRRYIGEYLARLLKNRGQIPIHVYAGGEDAWLKGKTHYEELRAAGIDAYLVDEHRTLDSKGHPCVIASNSIETKVRALLMRQDVQALVLLAPSSHTSGWIDRLAGRVFTPPHGDHAIEISAGSGGTN